MPRPDVSGEASENQSRTNEARQSKARLVELPKFGNSQTALPLLLRIGTMQNKLLKLVIAAFTCCLFSFSAQAQPLPEGITLRAYAPSLPNPDPDGKPISVVQPGDILFFTGKPGEVWCTDAAGITWYVAHAVALDPTHQRQPIVMNIIVDQSIPAGTRAEASLFAGKDGGCSPPEGFKDLISLTTR